MKKFKTLLFIVIITLISSNSYAFENVIGISGGTSIGKDSIIQQTVTSKTINGQSINQEYVNIFMIKPYKSINSSIEYQARFSDYILGISLNNINATYKTNLYNNSISLKTNTIDINLEALGKMIKSKDFGLNIGGSLGLGYFIIDKNDKNNKFSNANKTHQLYLAPKLLLDGEYKLNKKIILFSRFNISFPNLDAIHYDVNNNLKDPSITSDEKILSNKVNFDGIVNLGINFGIRYIL